MALPIRTTLEDIQLVCGFFATKPTGATATEGKQVLDKKHLDGRKLAALKYWGLIEESDEGRFKVTPLGRAASKDNGANRAKSLTEVVSSVLPYRAIVERAAHRNESSITATEVAAHWHEHFPSDAGGTDKILNDQAVCFFQILGGTGLGQLVVGRKGAPTRIDFNRKAVAEFADTTYSPLPKDEDEEPPAKNEDGDDESPELDEAIVNRTETQELGQGIFIGHGKNKKPLEQLKKILDQFKIPYKVAVDEPNLGRPIGSKVRDIMKACNCAILIFTADEEFQNSKGETIWRPSENVVHELGATSYLYENRIVIMKEDTVDLPTNFRDLGYISFAKDQLEAKAMEVLKELIGFGIVKVST